jgi:hypothetical protein
MESVAIAKTNGVDIGDDYLAKHRRPFSPSRAGPNESKGTIVLRRNFTVHANAEKYRGMA